MIRRAARIGVVLTGITLFAGIGFESPAEAKFLKNGVRAGDRSGLTILRRPSSGARKRIFAPGERRPGTRRAPRATATRTTAHSWFWKIHSTAASSGDPARFAKVLETMTGRRKAGKGLISVAALERIARDYRTEITRAARAHRVSEALILAVITIESRGSANAVSPKGATGLMQLIPATAKRFGVTDSTDPGQNIDGGAAYLSWLLRTFDGDPLLALAGYNAGEGAVLRHKGVPPYAETRDYVVLVMDALSAARTLCAKAIATPRERCTPRIQPG